MCQSVYFDHLGAHAKSVRRLRECLGVDRSGIAWHGEEELDLPSGEDFCLCGVDLPKTLAQSGYSGEWDDDTGCLMATAL